MNYLPRWLLFDVLLHPPVLARCPALGEGSYVTYKTELKLSYLSLFLTKHRALGSPVAVVAAVASFTQYVAARFF